MGSKEELLPAAKIGAKDERLPSFCETENKQSSTGSYQGQDDDSLEVCRVCHCTEPDKKGEAALEFLGISTHSIDRSQKFNVKPLIAKSDAKGVHNDVCCAEKKREEIDYVEYMSPDGEVFVCGSDLEAGSGFCHQNTLIELGCLCKNDLSLGHYACALRWFISHGSIICEICGSVAENIKLADMNRVMTALNECETLRARTAAGEMTPASTQLHAAVDPDAVAAVRRQRLTEIASWFNPRIHATVSQVASDEASIAPSDEMRPNIHPATKWVVEGTGILVATGLLSVTLAWLIAPRVGKKTAKSGLHILLGGLCALTVVVFLRFAVLPRIKCGRARYWAISFVFMFLVFGIWASRTRSTRSS